MLKRVTSDILDRFRLIYHQTTPFSNPVIESVLYQNKGGGMYYYGDMLDANYLVVHRTGFSHINLDPFDEAIGPAFFRELDGFIEQTAEIPDYLLLYQTPKKLLRYWQTQDKKHFRIRRRIRYQLDNNRFMRMDPALYAVPPGHELRPLQQCPYADLESFDLGLDRRFFDSRDDFLQNSFGFVLYDDEHRPTSISYMMGLAGRNGECDLMTKPDFRNKGYGYINITNYVRESILRKVNVGWDCFVDNHSNGWAKQYGYTHIIREYDFVSFAK